MKIPALKGLMRINSSGLDHKYTIVIPNIKNHQIIWQVYSADDDDGFYVYKTVLLNQYRKMHSMGIYYWAFPEKFCY